MEIGKVPNDVLKSLILDKLRANRPEVVLGPGIGEDCCALAFGDQLCVLSSDPVTGALNEVGRIAVNISCNDIASCGVEPLGLLATILMPPGTTEGELGALISQISDTAYSLNVAVIGGHTEITNAVNRPVVITTAVGRTLKGRLVATSGARPGDDIILTKLAGLEGTAVLARDRRRELEEELGKEVVERALEYMNDLSVVNEGIKAGNFGVNSMHDVTEGGVLGALWEVAEASGTGLLVFKDKIPVSEETRKICGFYGLEPLRLMSSGCMLITSRNGRTLADILEADGIKATVIGSVTEDGKRLMVTGRGEERLEPPGADELYRVG